jgi:hypothetical protein
MKPDVKCGVMRRESLPATGPGFGREDDLMSKEHTQTSSQKSTSRPEHRPHCKMDPS